MSTHSEYETEQPYIHTVLVLLWHWPVPPAVHVHPRWHSAGCVEVVVQMSRRPGRFRIEHQSPCGVPVSIRNCNVI